MVNSKSELQSQLQVALDKLDMMKLDISKGLIDRENHYLKRRIERLSTQIEELMSKKYTNQNLQNQKIMKDAVENNEEIKRLNKIIKDKDDKIMQIQTKVRCQEVENCRLQQQIEELQQKEEDSKKEHKLEITKVYNTLTSNIEEIY